MTHVPALTGLRGLACLLVLAFHLDLPGFQGGFLGVDLFFLLSGYLCGRILMAEATPMGVMDLQLFMTRRARRVLPLTFFVAGVIAVATVGMAGVDETLRYFFAALSLTQNIFSGVWNDPRFLGHFWSISTEMQYYLAFGLFAYFFRAAPKSQIGALLLVAYLASTYARLNAVQSDLSWWTIYASPAFRGSGLLLGFLLGSMNVRIVRNGGLWIAVALVGLVWVLTQSYYMSRGSLFLGVLGTEISGSILILAMAGQQKDPISQLLAHPILQRLGVLSFGIYLWHYPIARIARTELPPISAMIVTLGLSLILAALSYRYIEQPFTRSGRDAGKYKLLSSA